jgi:hypothetical protein
MAISRRSRGNNSEHEASIVRPTLRDYGGQVAHRATTENSGLFHGSSLPIGTLVQKGGTPGHGQTKKSKRNVNGVLLFALGKESIASRDRFRGSQILSQQFRRSGLLKSEKFQFRMLRYVCEMFICREEMTTMRNCSRCDEHIDCASLSPFPDELLL